MMRGAIFSGELPYRSIAFCGNTAIPAVVRKRPKNNDYCDFAELETYETGQPGHVVLSTGINKEGHRTYGYWGQQRCNNTWLCEECGPRRMLQSQNDLCEVCDGLIADGHVILMITFTLPHTLHSTISNGVHNLSTCIRAMLSGSGSKFLRKKYGLIKVSTTKECTFLAPRAQITDEWIAGAHYHEHAVFATLRHDIDLKALQRDISERWATIAENKGIIKASQRRHVLRHGVMVSTSSSLRGLSDSGNGLEKLVKYAIKGLGKYVTHSGKLSKKSDKIDSFTLRNLAFGDCPQYLPILKAFMEAIYRIPMFRLSPDLKKQYCEKPEKKVYENLYHFDRKTWLLTHSAGQTKRLLHVVKTEGYDSFCAQIESINCGKHPLSGDPVISADVIQAVSQCLGSLNSLTFSHSQSEHRRQKMELNHNLYESLSPVISGYYSLKYSDDQLCELDPSYILSAGERGKANAAYHDQFFARTSAERETQRRQDILDECLAASEDVKARLARGGELYRAKKQAERDLVASVTPRTTLEKKICQTFEETFLLQHHFPLHAQKFAVGKRVDGDLSNFRRCVASWLAKDGEWKYPAVGVVSCDFVPFQGRFYMKDYDTATLRAMSSESWVEEQRRNDIRGKYLPLYIKLLSDLRAHQAAASRLSTDYIDMPGHRAYIRAFGVVPVTVGNRVVPSSDVYSFVRGLPASYANPIKDIYREFKRSCFKRPVLKKNGKPSGEFEDTFSVVCKMILSESVSMSRSMRQAM